MAGLGMASLLVSVTAGMASAQRAAGQSAPRAAAATNPAATNPAALNPLPLRELYTQPGHGYLYTANWGEAQAAQQTYGLTMPSPRPIGYIFTASAPDTRPIWRLKQKSTGYWLMSVSQSEVDALTGGGGFIMEGLTGYLYSSAEFGAQQLNRYTNGHGWRLAYQSQDAEMLAAGYHRDGPVGYLLPNYNKVGAYYFGAYDNRTNPYLLQAVKRVYGRYPDPWGGVRDFSGDDPNVPQNTQGWTGVDWSYLKPTIGYYDDSQPDVLRQQITQATSHGLSYFAFYDYWNNATGTTQYDDAIKAFLAAPNSNTMQFMVTPCITPNPGDPEHLDLPLSQIQAAAHAFAAYTAKPNYLTAQDGRPMIFLCDTRGVGSQSIADQNAFISALRQEIKAASGRDAYILSQSDWADPSVSRQLNSDAYACVNIGKPVIDGSYAEYVNTLSSYFATFDKIRPTVRCAMSGFDERPRTALYFPADQARYFKDSSKSQFSAAMSATRDSMRTQPAGPADNYLTIYAWNEWAEGGIIEPNMRDQDYYLKLVQSTFALTPH
jgi:hypothetical protein